LPGKARWREIDRLDKLPQMAAVENQVQISEGGCLCGTIRFRLQGSPVHSVICHCTSCRKASGAPSVAWLTVERSQLEFLSGEPRMHRSSPGVIRQFCSMCGSALTYENARSAATIDITTVTLDEPNRFPPDREVWTEDRIPWEPVDRSLRQCSRGG
jgi:hypothetical protein